MNESEINDFWDKVHSDKSIDSLSGVKYDETIKFLKINKYIKKGINVLEIGTGLGYVTKELFNKGVLVDGIDISDVALNEIKNYCRNTYNIKDIKELQSNYYDVIICNNVIQHIPTDLLIEELKEFMRSLKIGGIFAVEFVSSDLSDDTGIDPQLEDVQAGRLCRIPKYLENILINYNGECELVFDKNINIGILRGHHVFHVNKTK